MKNVKDIYKFIIEDESPKRNTGKTVFKAIMITGAVLAFVPTVFKINKGKGFEGYGLLSCLKYEKTTGEDEKTRHEIRYNLIDLERYGLKTTNLNGAPETAADGNEDQKA